MEDDGVGIKSFHPDIVYPVGIIRGVGHEEAGFRGLDHGIEMRGDIGVGHPWVEVATLVDEVDGVVAADHFKACTAEPGMHHGAGH